MRAAVLIIALAAACGAKQLPDGPACSALAYTCGGADAASITRLAAGATIHDRALGVAGDVQLSNGQLTAIIDALDAPHLLAPTGGTLIDLTPAGGVDELNGIYQVAGILPADAFHYATMDVIDRFSAFVAVVVRGTLDGRPNVKVMTRWELRACDPGVRVRSELVNESAEPFTFFVADVSYWGGRAPLPFTVAPGEGFVQPKLDLVTLASWGKFPWLAARTRGAGVDGTAYGLVGCDRDTLEGVNDAAVTAVGAPRQIVGPGETVTLERMIFATRGASVDAIAQLATDARHRLGRADALQTIAGTVSAQGAQADSTAPIAIVASRVDSQSDGDRVTPISEIAVTLGQPFTLHVPAGAIRLDTWMFGRVVDTRVAQATNDITVSAPARLSLTVGDSLARLRDAVVAIVPADAATRDATTGTEEGRFQTCAPWLGPPHGGSPACNHVLLRGLADVDVPAGHYYVYASIGPFATLARKEVTLAPGDVKPLLLVVDPLPALAPGLVSADLHVHGKASFDSSIPDDSRVLSLAAAGIDVIAATDHDVISTYGDTIAALGLENRLRVLPGVETTGLIPFLAVPGDPFPRVIGHWNFWPVVADPTAARGGAIDDELVEPGQLMDRMDALLPDHGLRMLNHPWDEPQFGRDLGYLRAVGYDPRIAIPLVDDGTAQGMLARKPGGGRGNLDFDVLEIMNGRSITKFLQYRQIWWALLAQGRVYAAAANSDSHGLTDAQIGWPRNLVRVATPFTDAELDRAIAAGHMEGSYGVVIDASIAGVSFGTAPITPTAGATLDVEVRAAPWIPVTELRVIVNGVVAKTITQGIVTPGDPFGATDLVRWHGSIALADVLPAGGGDAWLIVEAGMPLPIVADENDDGVVDTTDNDGDGVVDQRDVEAGEDHGPLTHPPDPAAESGDPRVHLTAIAPGTWPNAFTNPFLIDRDGDGVWRAPGL